MPAVTHCRDTVSALPSRPAITMLPTFGVKPAIVSNVRLRAFQSSMFGGDANPRAVASDFSQIVTSCRASPYGSGRNSVASTSAKIALLAPMPSASVSDRHQREGRRALHLAKRKPHVVAQFFEPQGETHLTISLSAQAGHLLFEACHIAEALDRLFASRVRIHSAIDELAGTHLDVQRELLVDFLIDRDPPEPRTKGALHVENSTFETPAEKRRHVAISASSCVRPVSVSRYNLARRPSSDVPHSASTQPRRSSR